MMKMVIYGVAWNILENPPWNIQRLYNKRWDFVLRSPRDVSEAIGVRVQRQAGRSRKTFGERKVQRAADKRKISKSHVVHYVIHTTFYNIDDKKITVVRR